MAKGKKTGGRKKDTPNKLSADLKSMILEAFHKSGGVEYLKVQAELNPTAFMTLIGKVLPMTIAGDPDAPVKMVIEWEAAK